jgi:hypothetical protein
MIPAVNSRDLSPVRADSRTNYAHQPFIKDHLCWIKNYFFTILQLSFCCLRQGSFSLKQCCKKKSTRPINHRLGATGPPTLPIYVTGSNKKVNHGQWRSVVVKLAGNLKILSEVPKTHRKLILITYSNCLSLLYVVFLAKILPEIPKTRQIYPKLSENTQNLP